MLKAVLRTSKGTRPVEFLFRIDGYDESLPEIGTKASPCCWRREIGNRSHGLNELPPPQNLK